MPTPLSVFGMTDRREWGGHTLHLRESPIGFYLFSNRPCPGPSSRSCGAENENARALHLAGNVSSAQHAAKPTHSPLGASYEP